MTGNIQSTQQNQKKFEAQKILVIFIFDEPDAIPGQDWVMQLRAIERGSVPPVFDQDILQLKEKQVRNLHFNTQSKENLRGFFLIRENESFLDFKRRILRAVKHSERGRRWWRRHMNAPVPLYANADQHILQLIPTIKVNKSKEKKDRNQNQATDDNQSLKDTQTVIQIDQNSSQLQSDQSSSTQSTSQFTNETISTRQSVASEVVREVGEIGFEYISIDSKDIQHRADKTLEMIPAQEEPDISDLESTSYLSDTEEENQYNQTIKDNLNENQKLKNKGKDKIERKKKKQKESNQQDHNQNDKLYKEVTKDKNKVQTLQKKDKKIDYTQGGYDSYQRRTVRMQPEDFPVWVGFLKKPNIDLFNLEKHSDNIFPKTDRDFDAVGTELYPMFAPHAEMFALPPPPQLRNINYNEQQQQQFHYPEYESKAPAIYSNFNKVENLEALGQTFCVDNNNNPFVKIDVEKDYKTKMKDGTFQKSKLHIIQTLVNVNDEDNVNDQIIKMMKLSDDHEMCNILPVMLMLVPGKIHIYGQNEEEKQEYFESVQHQLDLSQDSEQITHHIENITPDQKSQQINPLNSIHNHKKGGDKLISIVMTQGRRILGQMTFSKEYPFITFLRTLTTFAVPDSLHRSEIIAYDYIGQKIMKIENTEQQQITQNILNNSTQSTL
ncbi:MAG: hypothetical protein EZS28_011829 [Streblomastix strix]|uniref:Uncharacterized protein n=1 Tax=Streblomastix strix TaxID=222440 RepID=A0A5J4WCH8_9EUKA|nr:MAG: hypothetical protein EZS28_011829 [Streblomastix strix]